MMPKWAAAWLVCHLLSESGRRLWRRNPWLAIGIVAAFAGCLFGDGR